jgi:hypothetical protein
LEPAVDGRRKYLHVGTDPQRQAQRRAAVDRGVRFARLREAIQRLKDDLREQDWEIDGVLAHTVYLHERAQEVVNQLVEVEAR